MQRQGVQDNGGAEAGACVPAAGEMVVLQDAANYFLRALLVSFTGNE